MPTSICWRLSGAPPAAAGLKHAVGWGVGEPTGSPLLPVLVSNDPETLVLCRAKRSWIFPDDFRIDRRLCLRLRRLWGGQDRSRAGRVGLTDLVGAVRSELVPVSGEHPSVQKGDRWFGHGGERLKLMYCLCSLAETI